MAKAPVAPAPMRGEDLDVNTFINQCMALTETAAAYAAAVEPDEEWSATIRQLRVVIGSTQNALNQAWAIKNPGRP